ncbi:UNKNOWN [Stylonychia lemnae]|uniref:Uncharacterized protein n=1 Tax=Stylonychia lemnae TaxID=5949 RepID=A0A078ARF5_STYLE|nr:UNKNOWN [Stylonychia lemnae]|eukprot:CDW83428.1 UNKNOWN [Stylonychia lemnae]
MVQAFSFGIKTKTKPKSQIDTRIGSPGPGEYDQSKSNYVKDKTPLYGFGKSARPGIKSEAPGPGSYEPKKMPNNSTKFSIGSKTVHDKMFKIQNEDKPGPGAYEQKVIKEATPQYSFGLKHKQQVSDNPGPGSYDASLKKQEKASGFGKSTRDTIKQFSSKPVDLSLPGPGAYNFESKNEKGFKMGAKISQRLNENPGPGSYEPAIKTGRPQTATFKMGTQERKTFLSTSQSQHELPGPGNYNNPKEFGKGVPTYKIGIKTKEISKLDVPGPGSYNQADALKNNKSSQSFRFNEQKRPNYLVQKEDVEKPGPGNYDPPSSFSGQKGVSIGAKLKQQYNQNPGPGSYDQKIDLTKATVTTGRIGGQKRKTFMEEAPNDLPGPGNYDQESNLGKSKGFSMQGKRDPKYSDVPGPGSYNENANLVKSNSKQTRMLSAKRTTFVQEAPNDLPGPGNYDGNLNLIGKGGRQITVGGKAPRNDDTISPGPGAYDSKVDHIKNNNNSVRISSSDRKTYFAGIQSGSQQNDLPGPGMYNPKLPPGRAVVIDKNEKEKRDDGMPGPGHYKVPSTFADVPKYNMPNQSEEFKWV